MSEPTDNAGYTRRLQSLQLAGWKHRLRRFDPYGAYLRSLRPGRTLEIGCGIGRNLSFLRGRAVGVDHNPTSVAMCRERGFEAHLPDELPFEPAGYDALLFSHVLEHLEPAEAATLVDGYLAFLRHNHGRVIMITPQERGYAADRTHQWFVDFQGAEKLCAEVGLKVDHQRSFPLPRAFGRWWLYNEFVTLATPV